MKNIACMLLCVISFCRGVYSNGIPTLVYVGFVNTSVSVPEGTGHVKLCVFKSGFVREKIDVLLSTSDNTAKAGVDYIPLYNKIVSFNPPSPNATACFLQNITDNNITEYNKTFYITMTVNHSFVLVEQDPHNLTITIINDDKVTVEFEKEAVIVEEDSKEGKVDLVCSITHGVALIPIHLEYVSYTYIYY
ncbi:uncharacterized protein LOC116295338 [Actinia tenebrosa]|uniref:Uncharacterized protein LOC116295338 n=1 Tax=Actinia tenebrosa TaxID=6105 RepID=A0A6P8HUM2_ACTTE|nr:uncharacterized protein LOC116295338 [Actinia tenebrosa]